MKRYFSPEIAGHYSGIATIGRIIFFLTASIAGVLLPAIKLGDPEQKNKKTLVKAIVLTSLIGGGALLTFSLFPVTIVKILIGDKYLTLAHLLPELSIFLFIVALANLIFFYLLALRDNFVVIPALVGPIIVFSLSLVRHNTVESIINNFLIGSIVTLLLLTGKIILEFNRKNNYAQINIGRDTGVQ